MRLGTAIVALTMTLLVAPSAGAAEYCVDPADEKCEQTLADALELAAAGPAADTIVLAAGDHSPAPGEEFSDAGTAVTIAAADGAVLKGADGSGRTLVLEHAASRVRGARIEAPPEAGALALALAGRGEDLEVVGAAAAIAVRITGAGALMRSQVAGAIAVSDAPDEASARLQGLVVSTTAPVAVLADGAPLILDDVDLVAGGARAIAARCTPSADAEVLARHVTITGTQAATVAECAPANRAAGITFESSVSTAPDPFAVSGAGTTKITTFFSAHAQDAVATDPIGHIAGDPLLDAARRPLPGSPLVDAGDPEPLRPNEEPFEDAARAVRMADGNGDGQVRRDAGAYELQPAAIAPPAGNVLANPDAETPGGIGAPPGWTVVGELAPMLAVPYGAEFLPSEQAASALGGGAAFFTAATAPEAALVQRIDIAASAASIDRGGATAALSGLLGGYGADEDRVTVQATFRDPEGADIGSLSIGPVPAAERGNATNLLHRAAARAIPQRARAIDVAIRGERILADGAPESYTDAFADNLALVLSVPGVPVAGPVDPNGPVVPGLRPFAGVTVLTATAFVTRRGRARVSVACASATVGSCSGTLELRGRLPGTVSPQRIARYSRFTVGAGQRARVTIRLTLAARRALRGRRSLRSTLRTIARDGQGVQRRRTVPVRLRFARQRRSGSRR